MRLSMAQYPLTADKQANLATALRWMGAASRQNAELIFFPELCLSPFFPQISGGDASNYLMTVGGEEVLQFQRACKDFGLIASPNIYLQESGKPFDASLMIDEKGVLLGVSKMVHIVQVPRFFEQDYYAPSDTGFKVYETRMGKIGIIVCFDRHYPESIRTCALRGAQLIIIPTANTKDEPRDMFEWELRVSAMQNGVYIAMCNRVGREGDVTFCGESVLVDPNGNIVARADDAEDLLCADLDFSSIERARAQRPYLSLRRPGFFER